jgi:hypothetical protein
MTFERKRKARARCAYRSHAPPACLSSVATLLLGSVPVLNEKRCSASGAPPTAQ